MRQAGPGERVQVCVVVFRTMEADQRGKWKVPVIRMMGGVETGFPL